MNCNNDTWKLTDYEDDKLTNHLIHRLPARVLAWNSKENFNLRFSIPSLRALKNCKWLYYNQLWINTLIIDVDRNISIDKAIEECLAFEFEPTWVCKTDKGVHVAFALENIVKYDWEKAVSLARHVKEVLTSLLKADAKGSHRLNGIWRNPLKHEFYYSGLLYSLNDFKYLLDKEYAKSCTLQQKFNKFKQNKKIIDSNFEFEVGNRDYYIWLSLMQSTQHKNMSLADIEYEAQIIHDFKVLERDVKGLTKTELKRIARSVKKYNDKNKNYVKQIGSKTVNRGAMGFEPIAKDGYINSLEHSRITKERQRESGINTQKGKDNMTRIEAAANMRKVRTIKTIGKLETALRLMQMSDKKINVSTLAKESGLSRNTVAKYIDRYKDENGKL